MRSKRERKNREVGAENKRRQRRQRHLLDPRKKLECSALIIENR